MPSPREIKHDVIESGYTGYLKDKLEKASINPDKLRAMKLESQQSLRDNIRSYRKYAFELHEYRKKEDLKGSVTCELIHTSISLKRNHI
ncbi:MAG: hypothetical protein AAF519_11885 [Bacteroidota bacterium]